MRLYGKKFLRREIERGVKSGTETRDAILWDVDETEHFCRVKIQGSGELITATYPKNWRTTPRWLKPGSAVKVQHRSGVRGYVEVVSEGRAIPAPVDGDTTPPVDPLADGIITGLRLVATDPESSSLTITEGTYRIDGTIYAYIGGTIYIMGTHEEEMGEMGTNIPLAIAVESVTIEAPPPEGYFRYDAFVICAGGTVQYVKGIQAASNPVKPTIPGGCLLIDDYILIVGGVSTVSDEDVGRQWEEQYAAYLVVTFSGGQSVSWYGIGSAAIYVKDQYGWGQSLPADENGVTVAFIRGGGTVTVSGNVLEEGDSVELTMSSSLYLSFTRNKLIQEIPPTVSIVTQGGLGAMVNWFLLDEYGDPM